MVTLVYIARSIAHQSSSAKRGTSTLVTDICRSGAHHPDKLLKEGSGSDAQEARCRADAFGAI